MAKTLENSPCRFLSKEGIGVLILVPTGFPLSSMSTTLLESNLGVMQGPGILWPTIKAFFFSPLMARRILSPTLPTPVLLYTWMHFGGRWYGVFPKALLSTTRTRVIFWIALQKPLRLEKKIKNSRQRHGDQAINTDCLHETMKTALIYSFEKLGDRQTCLKLLLPVHPTIVNNI